MATNYASFNSVTPLTGASPLYNTPEINSFVLSIDPPEQTPYQTKVIKIYRYIGPLDSCISDTDIGEPIATDLNDVGPHNKLIYNITVNSTNTRYIIDRYDFNDKGESYHSSQQIVNDEIKSFISLTDDLSRYYSVDSAKLTQAYGYETDDSDNKDLNLLNDIYTTRRTIYYSIATYVDGAFEVAPFFIGTHMTADIVDAFSAKTQVKHDVLHYEGDMVWQTEVNRVGTLNSATNPKGSGMSRTAVDINRLYLDDNYRGPEGRGGNVWATCRGSGGVFRFNLSNGLQTGYSRNDDQMLKADDQVTYGLSHGNGHGLCIDPATGDAYSCSYEWGFPGHFMGINYNNTSVYRFNGSDIADDTTQLRTIYNPSIPSAGLALAGGYGMTNIPGSATNIAINLMNIRSIAYFNTVTKIPTVIDFSALCDAEGMPLARSSGPIGYGIASGPDSRIWLGMMGIKPPNHGYITMIKDAAVTITDVGMPTVSITTDLYNRYPNTNDTNKYNLVAVQEYRVGSGYTSDVYQFSVHNGIITNPAGERICENLISGSNKYDVRGVGIDGYNNVIGLGDKIVKIYRMDPTDDVFPNGGLCRYPSVGIDDWPYSLTNTREIEWFLTRDPDVMTASAREGWLSLVDFNRYESAHDIWTGDAVGYIESKTRGWMPGKETDGKLSSKTWNYGIRTKNSGIGAIIDIRMWAADNPTAITGRRVHPNFVRAVPHDIVNDGPGLKKVTNGSIKGTGNFARMELNNYNGFSYQYSDFTGNLLAGSVESSLYNYDIIHPDTTDPTFILSVSGQNNLAFNEDHPECYPWPYYTDNRLITGLTRVSAVSAYDDANISFNLKAQPGSYIVKNWYLKADDRNSSTTYVNNNTIRQTTLSNYLTSVVLYNLYRTPSYKGRTYIDNDPIFPEHNLLDKNLGNLYKTGSFMPSAWIVNSIDLYDCSTDTYRGNANIKIYERWPEPRFYQNISKTVGYITDYFDTPSYLLSDSRYIDAANIVRMSNINDAARNDVIIGTEPLSSRIVDRSISRSFPITSWNFSVTSDSDWTLATTQYFNINYSTGISLNSAMDRQAYFTPLTSLNFPIGHSVISLTTVASGGTISDRVFSQCVNVKEMPPFSKFQILSGQTVSSNYSGESGAYVDILTSSNTFIDDLPVLSGYAPYLKVYVEDLSFAHTFPIYSYEWDFGDIYNETSNYQLSTTTNIISGAYFPKQAWKTDLSNHQTSHEYIMPGLYNITLTVKASNSDTQDAYTEYVTTGDVYHYRVQLEEILPTCGVVVGSVSSNQLSAMGPVSSINGATPLTAYFGLSGFIPGSFPICQIKWQFNDHVETISRYPATTATSQGIPVTVTDPDKLILPFIFDENFSGNVTVSVSAIVCNTNTVISCSRPEYITGGIIPYNDTFNSNYTLLNNRIDEYGNIIYTFRDVNNNCTQTVVLTGEI